MAIDVDNALRNIAAEITNYVRGAAELRVETRYIEVRDAGAPAGAPATRVGGAGDRDNATVDRQARLERVAALRQEGELAALTVINIDGDSVTVLPMRVGQSQALEIDAALLEQHQRHLDSAIEYRSRILNALLSVLQPRGRQL